MLNVYFLSNYALSFNDGFVRKQYRYRFMITVMRNTLVQQVSGPTLFSPNQESLLEFVVTHETEDIAHLNILLSLKYSYHAVSSFMFRACDMIYCQVKPHPNMLRANILAIYERVATTDWLVNTSSTVQEARPIFKGTFILVTYPFVPHGSNNCPSWITKQVRKLLRSSALQAQNSIDQLIVKLRTLVMRWQVRLDILMKNDCLEIAKIGDGTSPTTDFDKVNFC